MTTPPLSASHGAQWRIGIDVGGTFNDLVAENVHTGERHFYKEPSVPSDPSQAVERGLTGLMARAGLAPQDIVCLMHGTTLALNTILQRRGARIALVVSRGNRHVLELARAQMPKPFDFTVEREEPLVPAELVLEAEARVLADGTVEQPVTEADLDRLAQQLKAAQVEAVAVMLLNSYRHPALEQALAAGLRDRLDCAVVESAALWPEAREYERGLLAGLNAYVQPMMASYFDRLRDRLAGLGIAAPLYVTTNNGGTVSLAAARERPIDAVLSGPAAGVIASIQMSGAAAGDDLITFDMGGTSADMAVIAGRRAEMTNLARVGDFPIILPVVSVTAIGAGGGSILWRDAQGVLKIGPESAGSDPGPLCYGRGGTRPAITDCYLAAGIIDPARFLGGRMSLDAGASDTGLAALGAELGLEGADLGARTAEAGLRVATAMMSVDLTKLLARRGLDLRDFTMVAYGGAGATHAAMLARDAGLRRVLIPRAPGTFCALGASMAPIKRDFTAPVGAAVRGDGSGFAAVQDQLASLRADADDWITAELAAAKDSGGAGMDTGARPILSAMIETRFPDQAYDLELHFEDTALLALDGAALTDAFHQRHKALYGFEDRDTPVWVGTIRLTITLPALRPATPELDSGTTTPIETRRVWDGGWLEVPVYDRFDLPAGTRLDGPAILEQPDTTIWLVPGWQAEVQPDGSLLLCLAQD